jgi:hypothetical protein
MRAILVAAGVAAASAPGAARAYPEMQKFVQRTSGRNVNCALCHAHPDGPEGVKPGQIGSLTPTELERLNRARIAFEPGQQVDSPILNAFGDRIIERVGKKRFLALRGDPAALAPLLDGDLDGDGISDGQEFLDGTLPTDAQHGDPWRLFLFNLHRYRLHLFLLALGTACGLYGLGNFMRWFEHAAQAGAEDPESVPPTPPGAAPKAEADL